MNAVRVRIATDGTVQGLWTDRVDWQAVGKLAVRRASHVEFDESRQQWAVRAGRPRGRLRRMLQRLTGRPFGEIVYRAGTREQALRWEETHYGTGGPGWGDLHRRT